MTLKLKSLSTRDRAKELAIDAERSRSATIDLEGVEFVSRSFADELVNQAERRELNIINTNDDVAKMLDIVQ